MLLQTQGVYAILELATNGASGFVLFILQRLELVFGARFIWIGLVYDERLEVENECGKEFVFLFKPDLLSCFFALYSFVNLP